MDVWAWTLMAEGEKCLCAHWHYYVWEIPARSCRISEGASCIPICESQMRDVET